MKKPKLVCEDRLRHFSNKKAMEKVSENTSKRLCIYSDDGQYKLTATRRAIEERYYGMVRYFGSKWFIETHKYDGVKFVPIALSGLRYCVSNKREIIEMLSKSVKFTQAYIELVAE